MKYIITILASMFLFANIAHGENNYVREEVNAYLTHHYIWETVQHRVSNRVCNDVDIPIYSNKDKTGNIIIGSILGGIIGKKVDNGGDGGAVLGAILGGAIANADAEKNKTIIGYKRTTVCEDHPTFVTEERKVYKYSTLRFEDKNGFTYDIQFIRHEDITDRLSE